MSVATTIDLRIMQGVNGVVGGNAIPLKIVNTQQNRDLDNFLFLHKIHIFDLNRLIVTTLS